MYVILLIFFIRPDELMLEIRTPLMTKKKES